MSGEQAVASVGRLASGGIFWSLVKNWAARISTFVLFVLLARFLTPTEYGVAIAATTVLMLIGIISEFGFGDAIVQRQSLTPGDVNLPFYACVALSVVLAATGFVMAPLIETWLAAPGLAPVVMALCPAAPLMTISIFQEMNYNRALAFKPLAMRVLVANLIACPFAVVAAMMGAGVWSIVVQTYVSVLVGLIWLWARPRWTPSRTVNLDSFIELARFSSSVISLRLVDFAATRMVEVLIISRFGIATFGLYAVGSRLYQVLMQLLQSALNDVALAVLSRVATDRERLARIYLQAISIAAYVAAPVFVLSAALSSEICAVLFDERWSGVDRLAMPLLLLGAVQCVQYLNGSYLSARGKPNVVLVIALAKYGVMIAGLLLLPPGQAVDLVVGFALLQLAATPLSFGAVTRELGLSWTKLLAVLSPAVLGCVAAFFAVAFVRPQLEMLADAPLLLAIPLGMTFVLVYGGMVLLLGRSHLMVIVQFIRNRLAERRAPAPKVATSTSEGTAS